MKTDKQDNGVFAVKDLKAGDRFLYDAATAMEFPYHIYEGIDRLADATDNTNFQAVVDWIDRYAFGCYGAGGESETPLLLLLLLHNSPPLHNGPP